MWSFYTSLFLTKSEDELNKFNGNINSLRKLQMKNTDSSFASTMSNMLQIDIETQNGNLKEVIELNAKDGAKPSLYAKQMAVINGYPNVAFYVESYIGVRNKIGIDKVHYRMTLDGILEWDSCIPEQYRF